MSFIIRDISLSISLYIIKKSNFLEKYIDKYRKTNFFWRIHENSRFLKHYDKKKHLKTFLLIALVKSENVKSLEKLKLHQIDGCQLMDSNNRTFGTVYSSKKILKVFKIPTF